MTSTFPHDLGISTRVGLTRGVGSAPFPGSFVEAEARRREERLLAEAAWRRRRAQARASRRAVRRGQGADGRVRTAF